MPAAQQIVAAENPARRQRATGLANPKAAPPSVASDPAPQERGRAKKRAITRGPSPGLADTQIGSATKPARKGGAIRASQTGNHTPSPSPLEADARSATKSKTPSHQLPRDGHAPGETQRSCAVAELVSEIVDLQKVRRFCIKSQSRCDRSMEALIASRLGYRGEDTPEPERGPIFRLAANIRTTVEKAASAVIKAAAKQSALERKRDRTIVPTETTHGSSGPADIQQAVHDACMEAIDSIGPIAGPARAVAHLIPLSAASRQVWDKQRVETEGKMELHAKNLPTAAWAQSIRGFGLLNLAIVCGEAGLPISEYRSVAGLWKRCGLAVINGERQRQKTGDAGKEQKYNPKRRAEIYVVGSVSVFMAQKPGMRYRDVYDARRNRTAGYVEATAELPPKHPGKWSLKRCDNDARRVMTKSLLRDLWVESRRLDRMALAAE